MTSNIEYLELEYEKASKAHNWARCAAINRLIVEKQNEVELMCFPAGEQRVYAYCEGGGEPENSCIIIDRLTASTFEQQRKQAVEAGLTPYFDIEHRFEAPSFLIKRFEWFGGGVCPGVYCTGYLTDVGRSAIAAGMRYVSPRFLRTDGMFPYRVCCTPFRADNMGGLCYGSAFKGNAPLW